jgi:hypothetical protein
MNLSTKSIQFPKDKDIATPTGMIETMNTMLGSNYQIFASGTTDPIVLSKLPDEDLAPNKPTAQCEVPTYISSSQPSTEKNTDDYLFQVYLGSMTVVGLFILFRMIQKSK